MKNSSNSSAVNSAGLGGSTEMQTDKTQAKPHRRINRTVAVAAAVMFAVSVMLLSNILGSNASSADPVLITNAEQLMNIGNEAYTGSGGRKHMKNEYYKLNANITLTSTWLPACRVAAAGANGPFVGVLDGNGYTITVASNIVSTGQYFGVVGYAGSAAMFTNIKVSIGSSLIFGGTSYGYIGGVAGRAGQGTRFVNCSVAGGGTISGTSYVGGIVGMCDGGNTFAGCTTAVNVKGTGSQIGGIAGQNGTGSKFENSSSTGNVTGVSNLGGITGGFGMDSSMYACFASGNITGTGNAVGGVIGNSSSGSPVQESYATGAVTSTGSAVGGFVGNTAGLTFNRCYAAGAVRGAWGVGGFMGKTSGAGSANDCYATGSVTSTASSAVLTSGAAGTAGGFVGVVVGVTGNTSFNRCIATGTVANTATANTVVLGGFLGAGTDFFLSNAGGTTYYTVTLNRCVYAGGTITTAAGGTKYVGRLTGYRNKGNITITAGTYFYYLDTIKHNGTALAVNIGVNGADAGTSMNNENLSVSKTITLLKTQSTYSGWSFIAAYWQMNQTTGFPTLIPVSAANSGAVVIHTITTAAQLMNIGSSAYNTDYKRGDTYMLGGNITITAGAWTPYSKDSATAFTGILDGNGKTITISGTVTGNHNYWGIIGYADRAMVKDLNIVYASGAVMDGGTYTQIGTILGNTGGGTVVRGCKISGRGTIKGASYIGGIIGNGGGRSVVMSGCTADVNVTATAGVAGGAAGHLGECQMLDCEVSGNVTAGDASVGGFVGTSTSTGTYFRKCSAGGNVQGKSLVGGFVGSLGWSSNVDDCYAWGNVTSTGSASAANSQDAGLAGGFIGGGSARTDSVSMTFNRCYAAGTVKNTATSGYVNVGGFIGTSFYTPNYNNTLRLNSCAVLTQTVTTSGAAANVGAVIGYRWSSLTVISGTNTLWNNAMKYNGTTLTKAIGAEFSNAGHTFTVSSTNANLLVGKSYADLTNANTYLAGTMNWDFVRTWIVDTSVQGGRPIFRYDHPEIGASVWLAFNSYGGSGVAQIKLVPGAYTFTAPANPTFAGWTFKGWYSAAADGTLWINTEGAVQGDLTSKLVPALGGDTFELFARWESTVTYNVMGTSNHASYSPAAVTVTRGKAVTLASALKGTPSGWTFAGWYDSTANAYKTGVETGKMTAVAADYAGGNKTVYARLTSTVTYNVAGGNAKAADTCAWGASLTPAAATFGNWTFGGWFTSSADALKEGTDTNKVTAIDAGDSTGNRTLYARWTGKIIYNVAGSTVGTSAFTKGVAHTLRTDITTPTGWQNNGWRTGSVTGTAISLLPDTYNTAGTTVYANLTKEFSYNYNGIGVIENTDSYVVTYSAAWTFANPSSDGYAFGGWFVSADFNGVPLAQTGVWTDFTVPAAADPVPLYAKWTLQISDANLKAVAAEAEKVNTVSALSGLSEAQTWLGYFRDNTAAELQKLSQTQIDNKAEALLSESYTAMRGAFEEPVYAAVLDTAYTADDYSEVTYNAFSPLLIAARTGLSGAWVDASETPAELSAMTANYTALGEKHYELLNVAALRSAIAVYNGTDIYSIPVNLSYSEVNYQIAKADWTTSSWKALDDEIQVGLELLRLGTMEDLSDVSATVAALDAANGARVNVAALRTAASLAYTKVEAAYTAGSYSDLTAALTPVDGLLANGTQTAVDDATDSVRAAISGLVAAADPDEVELLKAAVAAADRNNYTVASRTASGLDTAADGETETLLEKARRISERNDLAYDVVHPVLEDMQAAVSVLVVAADKTILNSTIAETSEKENSGGDYTTSSFLVFKEALGAARSLAAADLSYVDEQEEVDAAQAALASAFAALVDIRGLNTAISDYRALVSSNYKPSTWAPLAQAYLYIEEERLLAAGSQVRVNEVTGLINEAIANLSDTADRAVIAALIATVQTDYPNTNEFTYPRSLWNELMDALDAAISACDNLESEQAAVDSASVRLEAAVEEISSSEYVLYNVKMLNENGSVLKEYPHVISGTEASELFVDVEVPQLEGRIFVRWEGNRAGMKIIGNHIFKAVYADEATVSLRTVTFLDEDDSEIDIFENITDGTDVSALFPSVPVKDGCVFLHWEGYRAGMTVVHDLVFKAVYSEEGTDTYTLTFKGENGAVLAEYTEVPAGSHISMFVPVAPVMEGKTFVRWGNLAADAVVIGDHAFTAVYMLGTPAVWRVSFVDDETVVAQHDDVAAGTDISLLFPRNPERDGRIFAGWKGYIAGMWVSGNHEFKAMFVSREAEEFTVTFLTDEGGVFAQFNNVAAGTLISSFVPSAPAKAGYDFVRWSGYTSWMTVGGKHEFKAVYAESITGGGYTINFAADGLIISSAAAVAGTDISSLFPLAPSKSGYMFAGWQNYIYGMTVTDNATFNAVFIADSAAKYEVVFEDRVGRVLLTLNDVPKGSSLAAVLPVAPAIEGFEFVRWNGYTSNMLVTGSHTFRAVYTAANAEKYAIKFIDADNNVIKTESVLAGTDISSLFPTAPAKAGSVFAGWQGYRSGMVAEENAVFKALYSPENAGKWTVTFVDEDGSVIFRQTDISAGTMISMFAAAAPEKPGKTFVRWQGLTGDMVVTGNHVFKAVYSSQNAETYAVTFTDADGTVLKIVNNVVYGTDVSSLFPQEPEREGNVFTGWKGYTAGMTVAGNVTFKASYSALGTEKYTVTFWGADGAVAVYRDVVFGTMVSMLVPSAPERDGFTFVRWEGYTASSTVSGNHTFRAVYVENEKAQTYTVVFLDYDGTEVQRTAEVVSGTDISALFPLTPERSGYTFMGWQGYITGMTAEGDITLRATYQTTFVAGLKFTVVFQYEDGTTLAEHRDVAYGTLISMFVPAVPDVSGRIFVRWEGYASNMMVTNNHVFRAVYAADEVPAYTITFLDNDGKTLLKQVTVMEGTEISSLFPQAAEREGYIFTGWRGYISGMVAVCDVRLLAMFEEESVPTYSVVFLNEDGTAVWTAVDVPFGTLISTLLPAPAYNEGRVFVRWENCTSWMTVTGDLIFKSIYTDAEVQTYNVRFMDDDGRLLKSVNAVPGTDISSLFPVAPLHEDEVFVGWQGYIMGMKAEKDCVFTARYSVSSKKYRIQFIDEDGDLIIQINNVTYGALLSTLVPAAPVKQGKTFVRWGNYTSWMSVTGNLVFKAVYLENTPTPPEFTVRFLYEDGLMLIRSVKAVIGTDLSQLFPNAPVKENWTFVGWQGYITGMTLAGDMSLIAKYELAESEKFTVTFMDENGLELFKAADVLAGTHLSTLQPAIPAREGKTFVRWDGGLTSWLTVTRSLTFTLVYAENPTAYTITFMDGNNIVHIVTAVEGADISSVFPYAPTHSGETFAGWQGYTTGMTVTGNATFSAMWSLASEETHTVKFTDENGRVILEINNVTHGMLLSMLAPVPPEREGYVFVGWKNLSEDTILAGDMTFEAVWKSLESGNEGSLFTVFIVIVSLLVLGGVVTAVVLIIKAKKLPKERLDKFRESVEKQIN